MTARGPEKTANVWHKDIKFQLWSFYITITPGATCNDSENKRLFGLAESFCGEPPLWFVNPQ